MTTQQLLVAGSVFNLARAREAVDLWLRPMMPPAAYLLYVHGKGAEPEKTALVLPDLVAEYGSRPLVLNWEDSTGFFPRAAAEAGGDALLEVLAELRGRPRPAQPVVLLSQSMGNFATQHLGKKVGGNAFDLPQDLLATIVLSAPAVEAAGHAVWLEPLAQRATTYVTINQRDRILRFADLPLDSPLGRDLAGAACADSAHYLDITGYRRKFHRYFRPNDGLDTIPAKLRLFYNQVLRGQPAALGNPPFTPGQVRQLP